MKFRRASGDHSRSTPLLLDSGLTTRSGRQTGRDPEGQERSHEQAAPEASKPTIQSGSSPRIRLGVSSIEK